MSDDGGAGGGDIEGGVTVMAGENNNGGEGACTYTETIVENGSGGLSSQWVEAEPEISLNGNPQPPAEAATSSNSPLADKVDIIIWLLNSVAVACTFVPRLLYNEIMASNIAWVIVPPVCFFIILVGIFFKSKFHKTLSLNKHAEIFLHHWGRDNLSLRGYAVYYFILLVVSGVTLALQLEQKRAAIHPGAAKGVFILYFILLLPLILFNVLPGWFWVGVMACSLIMALVLVCCEYGGWIRHGCQGPRPRLHY